ncbi:hypothetical protein SLG_04810 [Sphingobium sp. SYK-6]|uniref:hypothetical protein n=1 Tax=Sphingobium sp. (strain NBRC 103272 / SYK-6) TaxID=627192 RepID=UPI0002276749|nr:hypothetical protein [Sphingobium sp. SYK-6]BAK65156.1 hypothetical protein SLG_04810 [Sphingobium sp. SYK-6]
MILPAFNYFGVIFVLGFLLGTMRVIWLSPATDATSAVLIELPVMLAASGYVARRIVRQRGIGAPAALGMGAIAFVLLMAADAGLALLLEGRDPAAWAADLLRTPGWIGLAGQVIFALLPALIAFPGAPAPRRPVRPPEN